MSADKMEDSLYERKFNEMQQYIPFLERVIEKLKNNDNDKPRKAQLEKMQMLHSLLNNKQKKLKTDTLLKCESVLKKLHTKIEKSDELSPPVTLKKPSTTTSTPNTSSAVHRRTEPNPFKLTQSHVTASSAPKFVQCSNLIEINTCPASPTHFGEEDFRPPVEIPTERRCSPVRPAHKSHWDDQHITIKPQKEPAKPQPSAGPTRFQSHPSDYYHNNNKKFQQQPEPLSVDRSKNKSSRWSDPRDRTPETASEMPSSSSSFHKSWSSSSSTATSSNNRSHGHQRNEPKSTYSSEEENWDEPEDEQPPQKSATKPPLPPVQPPSSSSTSSSAHSSQRDSNSHHHRSNKLPSLPDITLDKDDYQNKLFHDTIFKYKKPEPPAAVFNPFINPPSPEPTREPMPSNIFHRLGEKVDHSFENFRIEVKNDKMKPKPPKPTPPPPKSPTMIPSKPIDEVLKSPPLSADDIDDLLNESLEAAIGKPIKPKPIEMTKDRKVSALELVRKKLAMISKAPPSGPESPPQSLGSNDDDGKEVFYRRGHTPTKKPVESTVKQIPQPQSAQRELFKPPPIAPLKNYSDSSPKSPPNPIDPIIERLALKYNPHRRRDSISAAPQELSKYNSHQTIDKQVLHSPPIKDTTVDPIADRLALKYGPHPRRDSMVSPLRTVDPRVGKILGKTSPLVNSPIALSPVPNVLPTINLYDPRLRNARPTNVDSIPSGQFCTPIPYTSPIPSLMDINLGNPIPVIGGPMPKPLFGVPTPSRLDPRTQKLAATIYAEKFNPERNDQTERMKYLESKKKKPPEPKTYGEYKQSKCRQQAAEEAAKAASVVDPTPGIPSVLSTTPSTLDKMYRNADYNKELGGSIHGFKIPKKLKSEEPKVEVEKEGQKTTDETGKKLEEQVKKQEEVVGKVDEPLKTLEEPVKKTGEPVTKIEKSTKKSNEIIIKPEESAKKPDEPEKKLNITKETTKKVQQSPKKAKQSAQPIEVEDDTPGISRDSPELLDESKSEDVLVIDERGDSPEPESEPEQIIRFTRRRGRPKAIKDETPSPEVNKEKEAEEDQEEKIKPRRIAARRLTTAKDAPKATKLRSESLSPIDTRRRSASDIFSPTKDNSIVSTQNIISGKRKTRASINFNEKATKKPATPKATLVTSPATPPKVRGKPGPKPGARKSLPLLATRSRRQTDGKETSDDGQICAVSSTTSQGGDADESRQKEPVAAEEVEEEPSSSGSKQQTPAVDGDENQNKQEWLEGFLKSIVDPTTNKDRILDMLKAVLDDKKLQQVKDILYSPDDGGRETPVSAKKSQEQNKPRATRTKKNELDRLNEDIRDMFICQGVVTATGRRMCTLAKESSKEKPAKPKEQTKEQPKERKTRSKAEASPAAASPTASIKRRMRKAKVMISPLNMRALRSRSGNVNRPPEMPVLEPNTPIKLPGEDEEEQDDEVEEKEAVKVVQPARKKPGPKSKRSLSVRLGSNDDDDIQLIHLKKKLKGADEADEKEKEEKEKETEEEKEQKEETIVEKEKDEEKVVKILESSKTEEVLPKNTNPEWHTMSSYASCCVICKEKSRFIAPHYMITHNDTEVYTSRLPPAVLKDIKRDVGNRALYSVPRKPSQTAFHYRCPFCDFQSTSTLRCWLEHFTIHTGEYQYKCSGCFKAMNKCIHLMDHIKKNCPEAKKINREPINLRGHTIIGYVCHLCNFVQMIRNGVVRHLKMQHDMDDEASIARIYEVKLIDSNGVLKMEENTESTTDSKEDILAPPPPPRPKGKPNESGPTTESNMEVFLSRELASPTSDVLTERLKSIDQDEGMTSDSSVNTVSTMAPAGRMTITERLSQRFKNIEKQNLLDDVRAEDVRTEELAQTRAPQTEEESRETQKSDEKSSSVPIDIEVTRQTAEASVSLPPASPSVDSLNESGNLIIDEQEADKSTADDDGTDSEMPDNDEDDNENWEDIEITETKCTSQKDKNKNKSIFQTLSRLYASIAPKKGSKRSKEKKKVEAPQPQEKPAKVAKEQPLLPPPTQAAPAQRPAPPPLLPPQISNISDLLPDSPSDSLDMLLATNFNCLEGDGTSFPHLDLNDLDSPIFLLSEEQTNLQDAIALATDSDHIKYDVLGDPLPPQTQPQLQVSSPTSVQRIGNLGFSLFGASLKYYCMVKACTFLFSDHPDGLQNHFLLEHPTLKWNGYCHTCQAQVCPQGGREMQHMLDVHSKRKPAELTGDKPRIKFRRLTGDILSTDKQSLPPPFPIAAPSAPASLVIKPTESQTSDLCLSAMLQSQPKAMIQPTPPPPFETDIPLYKNVSKEFTITGVAEGVTDNDLRNLVLNQAESTPGGMQISQVISLNAGGKSLSPVPVSTNYAQITDMIAPYEHRNSSPLAELPSTLQFAETLSHSNSPTPIQINLPFSGSGSPLNQALMAATSKRNSPVLTNSSVKPPAFKCGATNCHFVTSLRSAMNEHLGLHMRTDNDRGSLKCHECGYLGRNVTDYFQHMASGHSTAITTPPCPSTNELTQKIQDILRASAHNKKSTEGDDKDPLEVETESSSFMERLRKVAEDMVADTGKPDSKLWICPLVPQCTTPVSENDFLTHLARHISSSYPTRTPGSPFRCPHCTVSYHRSAILKAHIKSHGRHQFFCYHCCATFANNQLTQKHIFEVHSRIHQSHSQLLIPDETPDKSPFFIVSLEKLSAIEVMQFGEKLLAEWERKKALNKTHFRPQEQYLLPLQPIFNNQVFCSVCNYKTKVRTNMFRHLQLHKQEVDVASVDPVNPVPCLEKNEKHFDKMLNLACSSNANGGGAKPRETTGAMKIPVFVPDMRRFVCGHPGCTYLTITDQMLRSHLNALHSAEKGYQCPHCQEDICKKNLCAERIVQHLKFHGPKIYQCGECEYLHYTKHVVERHVHEKHSAVPFVNLVAYDRTEGEVNKTTQLLVGKTTTSNPPTSTEAESLEQSPASTHPTNKFKWECALCKHQTVTWNLMFSHANSAHRAKHQYQCVHCNFGSAHLSHIMDHIDTKHPTKTREAKYIFYKINETPQDKAADTRPLWLRDDPKRVRSIRGILMENEEDAERTKQSLSNAGVDLDDEDDDVEIVQVIESESAMKPGILGCFHCDYKSEDMSTLTSHWKAKHCHMKNNEVVPKLPFFFRIHSILKCPSCLYIGDYVYLQLHAFSKHGQRSFAASDPKLPNTCGHCPFVYPPKRLDILTRHYNREHKPTDVKNLSSSLLKSVLALGECQVYMQCYFCAEICADKTTIIEHERERHGSSNFRYKQIKDEVIYRCGMCQYSSTNEMATLRHMIDHFRGFQNCHFCLEKQNNFNAYMQHCYASHSDELNNFKEIYPLSNITAFLGQMLLIFPNGLIVNKRNLVHTQYGSSERIYAMYEEICKKALEPPIPPLCMARLMAKRSIEAKETPPPRPLLPPPPVPVTAKRIAKRRSTVAISAGDRGLSDFLIPSGPQRIKKRKASISEDRPVAPVPLFTTITSRSNKDEDISIVVDQQIKNASVGESFYGKQPEPVDLSKIYTQIAIGDKYAPVSVKKFALLFKMNVKVVVDKMDLRMNRVQKRSRVISKPCPASKKRFL